MLKDIIIAGKVMTVVVVSFPSTSKWVLFKRSFLICSNFR